jgi:hypothetical protein
MYCPQCGTESQASLQYCRLCGANLKVIGKAVTLSEAIARSDRGPLPKLKEMVKNFKIEHVTDEISGALDKMNEEIVRSSIESKVERAKHKRERLRRTEGERPFWVREKKTPERRREEHRVKGTVSFFTGIGLMIFLYNLLGALVLKLPPDILARIPFEIDPLVRVLWTLGLIPTLSGLGHFAASFFIRSMPMSSLEPMSEASLDSATPLPQPVLVTPASPVSPGVTSQVRPASSVTEHTTGLLTSEAARR